MSCTYEKPDGFNCTRPEGHSGPCALAPSNIDFQGTELERDVIQAVIAWYESQSDESPFKQPTTEEAALSNAVMALGAQQGGF